MTILTNQSQGNTCAHKTGVHRTGAIRNGAHKTGANKTRAHKTWFVVLAIMAVLSFGVPQHHAKADDFTDAKAAYSAGDYKEAARLYRLAADQGDADAQFNLGLMYKNGEGVSRDAVEAARLYRLAADQGDADAQFNLGVMYYYGEGVSRDAVEAARFFRLAADQGDADAQFNLGLMYKNGEGVFRDYKRAFMWLSIAAVNGGENSAEVRDLVEFQIIFDPTLGRAGLKDAEAMARRCYESDYKDC